MRVKQWNPICWNSLLNSRYNREPPPTVLPQKRHVGGELTTGLRVAHYSVLRTHLFQNEFSKKVSTAKSGISFHQNVMAFRFLELIHWHGCTYWTITNWIWMFICSLNVWKKMCTVDFFTLMDHHVPASRTPTNKARSPKATEEGHVLRIGRFGVLTSLW